MKMKLIVALMPFILVCLGLLSIVVGAFILNKIVGFVVLGLALGMIAFILSPDSLTKK